MTTINLESTYLLDENASFYLNADFFMVPSYRISPFHTKSINENSLICDVGLNLVDLLKNRFDFCQKTQGLITSGGRESIEIALNDLNLSKDDVISILTPSGNKYVSGCVTKTIERYCKWNRDVNSRTKAIFVIHEFGKLYEMMDEVYAHGVPVIEDYAHALLSRPKHKIKADYIVYSLPKALPIQYGGILMFKNSRNNIESALSVNQVEYINRVASHHFLSLDDKAEKQNKNYKELKRLFSLVGVKEYFQYHENETPSVFMLSMGKRNEDLKDKLQTDGVECSYFYGSCGFFIPTNYNLSYLELQHIFALLMKNYY